MIKIRIFSFHGATYDIQPIWKSKRLQFENVIERFGLILVALKGGYIEFLDSSRFIGQAATLVKLCEDVKLPEKQSKTDFPHKFVNENTLNYPGNCHIENIGRIIKFLNILMKEKFST